MTRCKEVGLTLEVRTNVEITLLLRLASHLSPCLHVSFRKPLARLDHLDDIDDLLPDHYRRRDTRDDPWPERVHLVRACHFECTGGIRRCEEGGRCRVGGIAGLRNRLSGSATVCCDRLEERRRKGRAGEGEEVEADEK